MINFVHLSLLVWSIVQSGCSANQEETGVTEQARFQEREANSVGNEHNSEEQSLSSVIIVNFGGLVFSTQIDKIGQVTILDYPSQWHGKVSLIRFDDKEVERPFSQEHCQIIRDRATKSFFPNFVRSDYRSKVSFEIAPFLSYEFKKTIMEAAQKAGYKFSAIFLKNPVDDSSAEAKIILAPNAISEIIGKTHVLEEHINLSRNGLLAGPLEKHLFITAGDFLCDLANKGASIEMTYFIAGSDKTIKVLYDYMALKN